MLLRPTPRRFVRLGQTLLWPRMVTRTQEQTHYFNCPYQVAAEDMRHTVLEGSADEIQVAFAPTPRNAGKPALRLTLYASPPSERRCEHARAT